MPKNKYNLKINHELYKVFDNYINDHIEFGYRSVSELLNHIIRREAKKILKGEELD